jgi:hypothetical protein
VEPSALDQQSDEPEHVGVLQNQAPVEPARFIVLAVSVVIALLAAPHLITHDKHGHAA